MFHFPFEAVFSCFSNQKPFAIQSMNNILSKERTGPIKLEQLDIWLLISMV